MPNLIEEVTSNHGSPLNLQKVLVVGAILLLVSGIILWFQSRHFTTIFVSNVRSSKQLLIGLLIGVGMAVTGVAVIYLSVRARNYARTLFGRVPGLSSALAMSVIAGFAEEIFFRATLQPIIGLWAASVLFMLVHSGHGSFDGARVIYLLFVFSYGMLLGYVYMSFGLVAAITAHAVFDLVCLIALRLMSVWDSDAEEWYESGMA